MSPPGRRISSRTVSTSRACESDEKGALWDAGSSSWRPLASAPRFKTGGYLSFSFLKGQAESGASQGSFQDLRGGALASGDLGQGFSFLVEARFRSESRFELEQALAGLKLGAFGDLRLGLFLVPFGKYNESNRPQQTVLVNIPLNLEASYPESWRDIGITTQGRMGFLRYAAYLANGLGEKDGAVAGQLFRDINKDKAKGGRLGLIFGEGFEIGASYYTGKYDKDDCVSPRPRRGRPDLGHEGL